MINNDAPENGNATITNTTNLPLSKEPGKIESMLFRFAQGGKYHRFIAEKVGDHCLPTTICDLQKRHGIHFERKTISVKNRFGGVSNVKLYWLEGDDLLRARKIVGLEKAAA